MNFIPTQVGPSKLEQVLEHCVKLTDENKEKVTVITDIAKIGKLLGHPQMSTENFYILYDMPVAMLHQVQHTAAAEYNTQRYRSRL